MDTQTPNAIGTAVMDFDGTIVLNIYMHKGDLEADGQLRCGPASLYYTEVVKHLGGMVPGQTKMVPPWTGLVKP